MKTIVLGVGNPILKDDGVGIHVIRQLKKYVNDPNVTLDEAMTGGMNLLDMIIGYEKAILIDTVKMKDAETGEVRRFSLNDFSSVHSSNPHDVDLLEALILAEKLGEDRIPQEIVVVGISVNETQHVFGEQLSEKIAKAVPKAVETVLSELKIR
jgi:hydrogenase maturation protease